MRSVATAELDGRPAVISGSDDGTVRVWDLATGRPLGDPFTGHDGYVRSVAAAELDGRPVVISGSDDGTVRVWDLATGPPVGSPFTGHSDYVRSVATAELDGRPVVVSGSNDGTVRVWDLATGDPGRRPVHRPRRLCDGRWRSGSWTAARWWSPAADEAGAGVGPGHRRPVGDPFTGHTGAVSSVAAAELDGRPVVISGSNDGTVRVWDLATGAPVGDPFTGHAGRCSRWRSASWTAAPW